MSTAITIEQAREANRALGTLDHIEAFLRGKGLDLQAADLARANTRITPVVLAALDTLGMKSPPPSEIAI